MTRRAVFGYQKLMLLLLDSFFALSQYSVKFQSVGGSRIFLRVAYFGVGAKGCDASPGHVPGWLQQPAVRRPQRQRRGQEGPGERLALDRA